MAKESTHIDSVIQEHKGYVPSDVAEDGNSII
jgi:hypothetical protein